MAETGTVVATVTIGVLTELTRTTEVATSSVAGRARCAT